MQGRDYARMLMSSLCAAVFAKNRQTPRDKMATTTAVSRERRARDDEQGQPAAALRDDYADDKLLTYC